MATAKDVIAMAKEAGTEIVDFRFCDLPGLMQHFSVPMAELSESVFEEGIGFDGSSIRGFQQIHESDMLLLPDLYTAIWWYGGFPNHYAGEGAAATAELGRVITEGRIEALVRALKTVKEDRSAPALQREFFERVRE